MINITGGTVNAVTRNDFKPAIGTDDGNLDLTINSSTGKTTVNACTTSNDPLSLSIGTSHYDYSSWKHSTSPSEGAEYNEDGSSNLGEDNTAIINSYRNTTLGTETYKAPKTLDDYAFHPTYEYQALSTMRSTPSLTKTKVISTRSSTTASTWTRPSTPAT